MKICLYCKKRELLNRKNAKTCGYKDCKRKYNIEWKRNKRGAKWINCVGCNKKILTSRKARRTCGAKSCISKKHPLLNKVCIICKKPYQTRRKVQRTCGSLHCQKRRDYIKSRKSRPPLLNKVCIICKKPYQTRRVYQITCATKKCQNKKNNQKENRKKWQKKWNKKNFLKKQKRMRESYLNRALLLSIRESIKFKFENPLLNKVCIICKKPYQTRRSDRVTCGDKSCMDKNYIFLRQKYYFKNYLPRLPQNLKEIRQKYLFILMEKQNNICVGCGDKLDLIDFSKNTIDHILPQSVLRKDGFTENQIHSIKNLQVLCIKCNSKKNNKIMENKYQKIANQKCFEILDILYKKQVSDSDFKDYIIERKQLIKDKNQAFKDFDRPQIGCHISDEREFKLWSQYLIELEKKWDYVTELFTDHFEYFDYFAHNYLRLLGIGKGASGWIGIDNNWSAIEKEAEEKNLGWTDRKDFGSYWEYRNK